MHHATRYSSAFRGTLVQSFELDPADITAQARLYEDLEIDSIDVIEPLGEVQRHPGKKATAADFRVHTVGDFVAVMQRLPRA